MDVVKDEVVDVERLSRKYNVKEKLIKNMIIIARQSGYLDIEIAKLIDNYFLEKSNAISNAVAKIFDI